MNTQDLKDLVRDKYSTIASQDKATNASSCCGAGGCSDQTYNIMNEDYSTLEGYAPDADLGLGCGLPTLSAGIRPGDTVLDLGSGAGNDCFVARRATGADGRVIGVDFTPPMIEKARQNNAALGYQNVEFRQGEIEDLPLSDCMVDVVLSNCVLNLVPDKRKAFGEVMRVLRPGGHFSISDVVLARELPEGLRDAAELYAGCVSGAIPEKDYLGIIHDLGFAEVTVEKRRPIVIPDDILANYLDQDGITAYRNAGDAIMSITVTGRKPETGCCAPKTRALPKEELKTDPEGTHAIPGCDLGTACC